MTSVVVRVPHRVSIAGGGTDFEEYFQKEGTMVLSGSIQKYVYVSIGERVEDNGIFVNNNGVSYYAPETSELSDEIDLVRAVLERYQLHNSLEVHIHNELPQGCGLGGSSALTVGLIAAVCNMMDIPISQYELAIEAHWTEADYLKRYAGWQDHFGVVYPGLKSIFMGWHKERKLPYAYIETIHRPSREMKHFLWLVYTGKTRDSVGILKDQTERMEENHKTLDILKMHAHEARKIMVEPKCDYEKLGQVVGRSWMEKKRLSPNITNEDINELYGFGLAHGAIGGKLSGAGSGGFMLFVVPPPIGPLFKNSMIDRGHYTMPVMLDTEGVKVMS